MGKLGTHTLPPFVVAVFERVLAPKSARKKGPHESAPVNLDQLTFHADRQSVLDAETPTATVTGGIFHT